MSRELKEVGKSEDTCQCASLFPAKVWAHLDRTRGELVQTAAEEAPEVCMEKKNFVAYPKRQPAAFIGASDTFNLWGNSEYS